MSDSEYRKSASRDRYYWLKEHGICVSCGQADAAPNHVRCLDCTQKHALSSYKRFKEKFKDPAYRSMLRETQLKRYHDHKEKGICVICSRKATHGLYCYDHSIYVKRYHQETAKKKRNERHERGLIPEYRKANGLCFWCGNPIEEHLKKAGCRACAACCKKRSEISSSHSTEHPWNALKK